jgi:hypothetical protein
MINTFNTLGNPFIGKYIAPPPNLFPTTITQSFQTGNGIPAGLRVTSLNADGTASSSFSIGTSDFTLEAFINIQGTQPSNAAIFGISDNANPGPWGLGVYIDVAQKKFTMEVRNPSTTTTAAITVPTMNTNTWYHIALIRTGGSLTAGGTSSSGGTMRLCFNGTRYTPSTGTTIFTNYSIGNTFVVGCRFDSSNDTNVDLTNYTFNGYIGQVRYSKLINIYTTLSYTVPTARLGLSHSGTTLTAGDVLCLINACTKAYLYKSITSINFVDLVSFRNVGSSYFYDISYNYINNNGTNFRYPTIVNSTPAGFSNSTIDYTAISAIPTNTQMIPLVNPAYTIRSGNGSTTVLNYTFRAVQTRIACNGFYTISASSCWDAGVPVSNGFNAPPALDRWASGPSTEAAKYNSSGDYIGTSSLGGINGEWLRVQFPFSFIPTKYGIWPHGYTTRQIFTHSFIASNDGNSWTTLRTSTAGVGNAQAWSYFTITTSTSYSYYAIVISKIASNDVAALSFAVFK